jgi:hypothetical protein
MCRPQRELSSHRGLTSVVPVVLHLEGAWLGATLCPISVSSVVSDQKLLAVSWLEGDLREELLLVVQYPCGAMAAVSVGRSVVAVVVLSRRGHQYVGRGIDVRYPSHINICSR